MATITAPDEIFDSIDELNLKVGRLERRIKDVSHVDVIDDLPAGLGPDDAGRMWRNDADGKAYIWTGTEFIAFRDTATQIISVDLAASSVTADKLAAGSVTATAISAGSITTDKLDAGAVTADKIAANSITTAHLQANVVTAAKIAANTITAGQIAADTITATEIAASAITTSELAAGAVTAAKITAGTITATEIAANTITAAKIAAGTITATEIAANTITGAKIAATTITAANIAALTITGTQIAAGTVTASKITLTPGGGNLQPDSSFESSNGTSRWAAQNATISIDTTAANVHGGGSSMKVVATTTVGPGLYSSNALTHSTVIPGEVTTLSAWIKGVSGRTMRLAARPIAGGTAGSIDFVATGSYQRVIVTFTPAAGVTQVAPWVYIPSGAVVGDTWWVDDTQIEVGDIASSYAPKPDEVLPGTIGTTEITALAITTPLLAANAVTAAKIAANTITAGQITAGTITTTEIAANTITASNIAASTITGAKIAATTITASNIVSGTITGTQIAATTITAANIAANTITATQIAAATITATQIASATITGSLIAASTITATNIATGTITGSLIAGATITGSNIVSGSITSTQISVSQLDAVSSNMGTLTTGKILIGAAGGAKIAVGTGISTSTGSKDGIIGTDSSNVITFWIDPVTGNLSLKGTILSGSTGLGNISGSIDGGSQINTASITNDRLVANTITAAKIAAGTITGTEIAGLTITAGKIVSGTITATQIATGTITADRMNVTDLSAISVNAGIITSGTFRGTTFESSAADPKTSFDSTGFFITSATGAKLVKLNTSGGLTFQSGATAASRVTWMETNGTTEVADIGTASGLSNGLPAHYLTHTSTVSNGWASSTLGSEDSSINTFDNRVSMETRYDAFNTIAQVRVVARYHGTGIDMKLIDHLGTSDFFVNNGLQVGVMRGTLQVGSVAPLSSPILSAIETGNANNLEFGSNNTAGFRSTLGYEKTNGNTYVAFHAEAGTTNNTYRTRGISGSVFKSDIAGGFVWGTVATASADNQALTNLMLLSNLGHLSITGQYRINGTQISASNLSNGITGSGAVVTASAPTIASPTLSGTITLSGSGKTMLTLNDTGAQSSGITIGGDTNLYRGTANQLKTDDDFLSTGRITASSGGTAVCWMGNPGGTGSATIVMGGVQFQDMGGGAAHISTGGVYVDSVVVANYNTANLITLASDGHIYFGSPLIQFAASHLSNGTTGSGSVVLATSPTISGPSLTGSPTAPTQSVADNSTKLATTAFVNAEMGRAGSAFPTTGLYDGMIFNLQVPTSGGAGQAVVWSFRYNATGGTYKWEFIGGPPYIAEDLSSFNTASTSFVNVNPVMTVPVAGVFTCHVSAQLGDHGMSIRGPGLAASDDYMIYSAGNMQGSSGPFDLTITSSGTVGGAVRSISGASSGSQRRRVSVLPVRCI